MGLDQYLSASRYVGGWNHSSDEERALYGDLLSKLGLSPSLNPGAPSLTVKVNVAYWRKANQIHGWFVANVQDGVDECQVADVEREKLVELRDLCKQAIEDKQPLIEPKSGFFFGSMTIDDWYWEDLKLTVRQLDAVLNNPVFNDHWTFAYQSSW